MPSLRTGRLPADWQKRLPQNSTPYTSTIVFLVRKGNPKQIQGLGRSGQTGDFGDHAEPQDFGGARWNYLAAWAYALKQPGGNDQKAHDFVKALYRMFRCWIQARADRLRRLFSAKSAMC